MADRTINRNDAATTRDQSLDSTPKPIAKGTWIMFAATIVFIVIASILIAVFFSMPAGN